MKQFTEQLEHPAVPTPWGYNPDGNMMPSTNKCPVLHDYKLNIILFEMIPNENMWNNQWWRDDGVHETICLLKVNNLEDHTHLFLSTVSPAVQE